MEKDKRFIDKIGGEEMDYFTILKPGQRLRQIRKRLGLTQGDLSAENMSKNYISMFENGKRPINVINATYLADILNSKAKEMGINLNITSSYFIKSEKDIAKELCLDSFNIVLDKSNRNKHEKYRELYKIIYLSQKYDLPDLLAKALKLKGKFLYREGLYSCAITHFSESLLLFFKEGDINGISKSYLAIGQSYFMDNNYEMAITYYNLASLYGNEDKILYYKALSYYKLGNIVTTRGILDRIIFKDERVLELEKYISNFI